MERKYLFEAGLSVYLSYKTLIPVEWLEMVKYDGHDYHIYAVLSYNQVYIRKDKIKQRKEGIEITIFMVEGEEEIECDLPSFKLYPGLDHQKVKIEITYPYKSIKLIIQDRTFMEQNPSIESEINILAQALFQHFAYKLTDKQEFEVLYVGQAYGTEGSRDAFDRLSSHSTLQKILTEYQSILPNKKIYILLMEFTTNLMVSMDGISGKYTKSEVEDKLHMKQVISDLPKEKQIINITEAALIHYFKPYYNEKYKNNFPDEKHKGYRQYFDLDYNALTIEMDLDFPTTPQIQIYTSINRIKNYWDYIRYSLHNDKNRKSMFDIFETNEN